MNKLIVFSLLMLSTYSYAQEDYKAHLENPNEVGVDIAGLRNYDNLPGIYYERQLNHHTAVGIITGYNNYDDSFDDGYYYYDDETNANENFYFSLYGRYYVKDYITQSFLYLLFDHDAKVRYFIEGSTGLSTLEKKITERTIDNAGNYVLQRNKQNFTDATLGIGFGSKILYKEKFSLTMITGLGGYLFNDKNSNNFFYFNFNLGYRF